MSSKGRLVALEQALQVGEEAVCLHVVSISDDDVEPDPGDCPNWSVVYLPTQAASAEEWYEKTKQRFGSLRDGPPDSHGL